MTSTLVVAAALFGAVAWYGPGWIRQHARRFRMRPPHPYLLVTFQVWFGVLALGTVWLLVGLLKGR
jgi:hypothetical protein